MPTRPASSGEATPGARAPPASSMFTTLLCARSRLERNLPVVEVFAGRGRLDAARGSASRRRARAVSAALDAVDELHVGGLDLVRVTLVAFAVSPLLGAEAPLDVDLLALGEVLRGDLRLSSEGGNVEPRGDVHGLAVTPLALVRGHREVAHGGALR